jgi:hypothetical protein
VGATAEVQQIRALLECVWPAALGTAQQPLKSITWAAALTVVCKRDGGDLTRTRRLGLERFESAVRGEILRADRQKPCRRIVRLVFSALTDPAGVIAHRLGALERVALLLSDWRERQRRLADTETRMLSVLEEWKLTELVTSITGLSAIGAASILAQTGDPRRFTSARAPVKHSGLAPREKLFRDVQGQHQTHRPRPTRTPTRHVAGGPGSPTSQPRPRRPLHPPDHPRHEQAESPASPGRDRYRTPATPACRPHHRPSLEPRDRHPRHPPTRGAYRRPTTSRLLKQGRGEPPAALRHHGDLDDHGQPRPSSHQPDDTLPGPTPFSYAGTDDRRGPDPNA